MDKNPKIETTHVSKYVTSVLRLLSLLILNIFIGSSYTWVCCLQHEQECRLGKENYLFATEARLLSHTGLVEKLETPTAQQGGISTPQERDARAQGILERDTEEVLYIPEPICKDLKANSVQSFSPL